MNTQTELSKIEQFAEVLQRETIERLRNEGITYIGFEKSALVTIKPGKKYTKVDIGGSGKYMVDDEGNIYGIKAYGVIHRGHYFGTLDTINDYYWGNYRAYKK